MFPYLLSLLLIVGGGSPPEAKAGATQSTAPRSPIPAQLESNSSYEPVPVWVSADQAIDRQGQLRNELFRESSVRIMSRNLKRHQPSAELLRQDPSTSANDPCEGLYSFVSLHRSEPAPNYSFHDLMTHADGIYSGTIERMRAGFFSGDAGSILQLDVDRVFRHSPKLPAPSDLLIHYPYARETVSGYTICKNDPAFPYRPTVGARILIFVYGKPIDKSRRLIVPESNEIFFEGDDGKLLIPLGLKHDPASNLTTMKELEQIIAADTTPRPQRGGRDAKRQLP